MVPNRLYLDTMVFAYYFFQRYKPDFSGKAVRLLKKIEDGKYEGIISILSILELIKVIRSNLVEGGNCSPRDWQEAVKEAVKTIYKMKNLEVIEGNPDERLAISQIQDLLHSSVLWYSFEIINKYPGTVRLEKEKYVHDGLSAGDAMHITLAKRMGCAKIATFDHDYKESRGEIELLMLQEDIF